MVGNGRDKTSFATVIEVKPDQTVNIRFLEKKVSQFIDSDDVFRSEFLTGIILQGSNDSYVNIDIKPTELFDKWATEWIHVRQYASWISQGPYAVQDGEIFQIWRLYDDEKSAFLQSVWPEINVPGYVSSFR